MSTHESDSITTHHSSEAFHLQPGDLNLSGYSYSAHRPIMETFHGPPGADFEQLFIRRPTADYGRYEGNPIFHSAFYPQEPQLGWHEMHPIVYQYPRIENSYQRSTINDERVQNDAFITDSFENFSSDYAWPRSYESEASVPAVVESMFESGYLLGAHHKNCTSGFTDLDGSNNAILDSPADLALLSICHSPTLGNKTLAGSSPVFKDMPALVGAPSCKASDDSGEGDSRDGNLSTFEGRMSDAPYAKLIYRALMEAPNHSMVLQDIYQWFIDNTGKGSSTSTGWRNSIRHNLSMNAAFRKTSRKSNGDDSKRTSEWVLEPFAIVEGVTPTTRYRKNGKKAYKSRNSGPRVRSGRSAGIQARKSQSHNHRATDSSGDMKNDQQQRTPMHDCTPSVIDQPDLSLCTPDVQQVLPGSTFHSAPPLLRGWEQYADLKSIEMNDGGVVFMDERGIYGDRHPYVWTNSHCY